MPYKDKEKQREVSRIAMAKKRNVNLVNPDVIPNVNPSNVNPVNPDSEEVRSLKGRIAFLVEQLTLANQELLELKASLGIKVSKELDKPIDILRIMSLPIYNWRTAQVGRSYKRFHNGRWVEIVAQEVDAEGNQVW